MTCHWTIHELCTYSAKSHVITPSASSFRWSHYELLDGIKRTRVIVGLWQLIALDVLHYWNSLFHCTRCLAFWKVKIILQLWLGCKTCGLIESLSGMAGTAHSEYLSLDPTAGREWSALRRSCVTKIYANVPPHMLILHIYIKLNRLLHCFLTSASIHDYLFWFLCKMAYKHGAGILSACHWVCFQWRTMAPIIVLILQGLHQESMP